MKQPKPKPTHSRTKKGEGAARVPKKRLGIATYRRVAAVLRRRISTGEWQTGDRLPALDTLVEEFKVGRVTVRHALDLLAEEGLIARHRDRRGSSVIAAPLDGRWFTLALDPSDLETHSAFVTVTELSSEPWGRPLPVSPKEGRQAASYHRVVHLHHHTKFPQPVAMTELLIESGLFAQLEPAQKFDRPILERLAARHTDLGEIRQTLTIGEADLDLAKHLGVHEAAPIAEMRRIICDSAGAIIYFGHLYFRGDLVRLDFAVDLTPRRSQ